MALTLREVRRHRDRRKQEKNRKARVQQAANEATLDMRTAKKWHPES